MEGEGAGRREMGTLYLEVVNDIVYGFTLHIRYFFIDYLSSGTKGKILFVAICCKKKKKLMENIFKTQDGG